MTMLNRYDFYVDGYSDVRWVEREIDSTGSYVSVEELVSLLDGILDQITTHEKRVDKIRTLLNELRG